MRALQQHILAILDSYEGGVPLAHFLKGYFKAHPILGSRDRKVISDAVYSYYRCAKALPESLTTQEKLGLSVFLAENEHPHTLKLIPERLTGTRSDSLAERISVLENAGISLVPDRLLSPDVQLSSGISKDAWLRSMWRKPRVFFRIMSPQKALVREKLFQAGIELLAEPKHTYSCAPGTALEKVLSPEEYRIQDLSSQRSAEFFSLKSGDRVWDCCSGAGGKSLLACETQTDIHLTVSDVRSSVLHNLVERFRLYKRAIPEQILVSASDSTALSEKIGSRQFDHIIADVPCSGSGTWARTPEQLYFFRTESLKEFSERQTAILNNVSTFVKPGGYLSYITCSVFAAENEQVLQALDNRDFELLKAAAIDGIEKRADCMFAALWRRKK